MTDNAVTTIDATAEPVAAPEVAHLPADPMVSMIERVVMDPDADLEKLEKMLDVKERLEAREAQRAFDRAIAVAKSEIGPITKDGQVDYTSERTGQRTNFRHETLHGIAKIVDPVLSANGLSYRFRSEQKDGQLHVTCVVAHRDGHSEETTLQGAPDTSGQKNSYQAVGSAATYLQRYTLKLALGLSAADDDDATGASNDAPEVISEQQYIMLQEMIDRAGIREQVVLDAEQIPALTDLPADKFTHVRDMLQANIDRKERA